LTSIAIPIVVLVRPIFYWLQLGALAYVCFPEMLFGTEKRAHAFVAKFVLFLRWAKENGSFGTTNGDIEAKIDRVYGLIVEGELESAYRELVGHWEHQRQEEFRRCVDRASQSYKKFPGWMHINAYYEAIEVMGLEARAADESQEFDLLKLLSSVRRTPAERKRYFFRHVQMIRRGGVLRQGIVFRSILLPIGGVLYVLARISIIGVAFSCLRAMPRDVYVATWTRYIPSFQ
jgi:hypothetical protein